MGLPKMRRPRGDVDIMKTAHFATPAILAGTKRLNQGQAWCGAPAHNPTILLSLPQGLTLDQQLLPHTAAS